MTPSTPAKGLFIVVEGLEGSGKTTQVAKLKEWFQAQGREVVVVHEPGGTPYGEAARTLFLNHHRTLVPEAEVGLLLTAKIQLLKTVVEPALAQGKIVLCDRFTDTLYAYQHFAKGHDINMMNDLVDVFTNGCETEPDFTILYQITPETSVMRSLARKNAGGAYTDLDAESLAFHNRVRNGLTQRLYSRPLRQGTEIFAEDTIDEVFRLTTQALCERFGFLRESESVMEDSDVR